MGKEIKYIPVVTGIKLIKKLEGIDDRLPKFGKGEKSIKRRIPTFNVWR